MSLHPHALRAFADELSKIANTSGVSEIGRGREFLDAVQDTPRSAGRLLNPMTIKNEVQDIWKGTSNQSSNNRALLADEVSSANEALAKAGKGGKYVDDVLHNQTAVGKLRRGGWLANFGKYEGGSTFLKARNAVARALPGQRTVGVGFTALGVHSDLQKRDATGRERGGAERLLGAGGNLVGGVAGLNPVATRRMLPGSGQRFFGGGAGSLVGGMATQMALGGAGRFAGRKIDEMRGFKPTPPPETP